MSITDHTQERVSESPPRRERSGWWVSLLVGAVVGLVYMANGREIESPDTAPTALTTLALLNGDGIYLDRFFPPSGGPNSRLVYGYVRTHGHVLSRYPVAPALLALPVALPLAALADRTRPGWRDTYASSVLVIEGICQWAAAVTVALAAVTLHRLLRAVGLGDARVAVPAVLAAALGSDLWVVASQTVWQHGPAALMLTLTAWLLVPAEPRPLRVFLASVTTATMVACRSLDVILAAAAFGYLTFAMPRKLVWFLPGPLAIGAALIGYNLWFFDNLAGGQSQLEALHPRTHNVSGPWSGDLLGGLCGTLFSPNRGLFVFSPWVAVALVACPFVARRASPPKVLLWLFAALVPYTLVLSKYAVWWAGHSFGPRYWTDVIPLLAVGFAYALDWAERHCRPVVAAAVVAVAVSITFQTIGAFCFPSSWNHTPLNVDLHHERLWDWRDTELSRCLTEAWKKASTPKTHGSHTP